MRYKHLIRGVLCLFFLFLTGCGTLRMAEVKMAEEDYVRAVSLYEEYLREHPDEFRARSRLGFALLKTGQMDRAVQELETVLKDQPGDPYSVLYLGLAYLNKEEFDKASSVWQGYRNRNQPLVEAEISRLLTLIQISQSQREAQKAVKQEKELMGTQPDPDTVAVCYFQDLSPDQSLRAFQKGLAAMVITDLSKVKRIKVVERMRMQALVNELELGQTAYVDQTTAPKVGKLLGAENLVSGNLSLGSIQATTTITSSSTGTVKSSVATPHVEKEKFYELPRFIVSGIVQTMNIRLTPEEAAAIKIPQTQNYQAFVYFGQALDALDAGNWKLAKDLFSKAVEEDPMFEMARNGRDGCPEIYMPNLDTLRNAASFELSREFENALNTASLAQRETDALVRPEVYTDADTKIGDDSDLPEIVRKGGAENKSETVENIREVVDQPLIGMEQTAPSFPDPPVDEEGFPLPNAPDDGGAVVYPFPNPPGN